MPETEPECVEVCLDAKKAREACILEKGEENCADLIAAYTKCLEDAAKPEEAS
jgi:cytochrome c oxidase assembly protein subunit 17